MTNTCKKVYATEIILGLQQTNYEIRQMYLSFLISMWKRVFGDNVKDPKFIHPEFSAERGQKQWIYLMALDLFGKSIKKFVFCDQSVVYNPENLGSFDVNRFVIIPGAEGK